MASRRYLRPREVADSYGIAEFTLAQWRCRGDGPPFAKPSATIVLYEIEALEQWLRDRTAFSTAAIKRH